MRFAWIALLAACSFHHGEARRDAPDTAADSAPDSVDAPPDAPPSPFALSGMRWMIPCTAAGPAGNTSCTCAQTSSSYSTTVVLAGSATEHWQVSVHIAGVMEGLQFANGTPDASSQWYIGGNTGGDNGDNFYEIIVSSPSQHYYLNNAPSGNNYSVPMDYTAAFPIDGDATVMFVASPQDMYEWQGVNASDQQLTIAGYTAPPPTNGRYPQWAYLTVVSAAPR